MIPTRIVATVGPASASQDVLGRMMDTGVHVLRLNLSHGRQSDHEKVIATARRAAAERGLHIALLADLCGPKVRTNDMDPQDSAIKTGDRCAIVRGIDRGTALRFGTNYAAFVDEVEVGHRVLIDDGTIQLRVLEQRSDRLSCECEIGGTIGSRKGLNVPDSNLSIGAITAKDEDDLKWAIGQGVDFVALSFVRRSDDVQALRRGIRRLGADTPIVSKIETPQAIGDIDAILQASDAILVARGDLGVEMNVTQVPFLQKDIVWRCRRAGKPVIIATQMLHSMTERATPTRAEVSDVANAALEGADAVMLSGESATGAYPVESVAMMNRICKEAYAYAADGGQRRSDGVDDRLRVGHESDPTSSAVARSAAMVAQDLQAKLVAVWCRSGRTARWISKYRIRRPLVALAAQERMCRRMALSYGLDPLLVSTDLMTGAAPWEELEATLAAKYGLEAGDVIVEVGDPRARERGSSIAIHLVGMCPA